MDRRQRRTRAAIFKAFTWLLAQKQYQQITTREIIDAANIGRSTFYAHFAAKDELLRTLCEELFRHITQSVLDHTHTHGLTLQGGQGNSVFCHLLQHLKENDHHIRDLLACENNEPFLQCFRESLTELLKNPLITRTAWKVATVPEDFILNHLSGSFVVMVQWWLTHGLHPAPRELDRYFRAVTSAVL